MDNNTTPGNRIAVVTGADRGLGHALAAGLLEKGWRVFAGQYNPEWPQLSELAATFPGTLSVVPLDVASADSLRAAADMIAASAEHVDLLINNAGVMTPTGTRSIREEQDYDEMHRLFRVNAMGPLRVVETLLPLLERGQLKRLCFVSSEAGSINRAERKSWFGYCSSKTALNMGARLLFNRLRPRGYTFRLYHPGWMRSYMSGDKNSTAELEPEEAAVPALAYFLRDRAHDPHLASRNDEDRLVMRDWRGVEWPF